MSQSSAVRASVIISALALAALGAPRAQASDESSDTAIEVKAPIDATACTATPPTVTVLGLNMDVTSATFGGGDDESGDDSVGKNDDNEDPPATGGTCADLVAGSSAQVKLASDLLPLEASEVDQQGDDNDASVQAPVQAFDATAKTVAVLGLTIDASQASFEGSDDGDDDGAGVPIDLSQLIVGQIVEVRLDSAALPALVATSIDVKNFANQVEVEVDDDSGSEVDDDVADIEIQVDSTVKAAGKAAQHRVIHLRKSSNGSFVLTGLPTGKTKIRAIRSVGGKTWAGKAKVKVQSNSSKHVTLTLKKSKSN